MEQELNEIRYNLLKKETEIGKLKQIINEKAKLIVNLQQHINTENKQERTLKKGLSSVISNTHHIE